MNGVTDDAVFCPSCGLVHDDATTLVHEQQQDILRQAHELSCQKGTITKLQNGEGTVYAMRLSPAYPAAMRVLRGWQSKCAPNTRELEGKRLEHCLARLRKYNEDELDTCVDGYARFPFLVGRGQRSNVGTPAQWRADAEMIFRTAEKVDQGIRLAQEQVTQIPHAVLEQMSWKRIRELNYRAIIGFLTERFGPPVGDLNGFRSSPCPNCDDGRALATPLRITPLDMVLSYLVECASCGLNDSRILPMVAKRFRAERVEVAQLELACV